jgi:hypothetical protein
MLPPLHVAGSAGSVYFPMGKISLIFYMDWFSLGLDLPAGRGFAFMPSAGSHPGFTKVLLTARSPGGCL